MVESAPSHRDQLLERRILPHCQPLIEAIGYRMAFEAAVERKVDPRMIELFVASVIKMDPAWYVGQGIERRDQASMEENAAFSLLPDLDRLLDGMGVERCITAPIISDQAWDNFIASLETLKYSKDRGGSSQVQLQSRL